MEWADDGDVIIARFNDDEDFFDSMFQLCIKAKLYSGNILTAIGMLKQFEIGFFTGKNYEIYYQAEPAELLGINGTIAFDDVSDVINDNVNKNCSDKDHNNIASIVDKKREAFRPHFHAILARENHGVVGGHLRKAKVSIMNEIIIRKNKHITLFRETDSKTSLSYLKFR